MTADIYLRRQKKLAKGYPFSEVAYVGIDSDERTALALHRLYRKEDKESTGERSSLILCSPEQVLKMRNFDERNIPETSSVKSGATEIMIKRVKESLKTRRLVSSG